MFYFKNQNNQEARNSSLFNWLCQRAKEEIPIIFTLLETFY